MTVDAIVLDMKHAARVLSRRPAFTLAAVLTLALGIGGTSVIVSAMRAVFWRPLPYPSAHELVMVSSTDKAAPAAANANSVSPPDFSDWRASATSFVEMAAIRDDGYALPGGAGAEQITGNAVTGGFFTVFNVPPAVGRYLTPADAELGARPVVVLSHGLWQRRFGADRAIVGQTIQLEGVAREVVGIMPASFNFPIGAELWTPLPFTTEDLTTQRGAHYLTVVARLRAGVSRESAVSEMTAVAASVAANAKSRGDAGVSVAPLRDGVVGDGIASGMQLMLGAVALVFLVACVNVSSLVLGQALGRRRDFALRTAIGASRGRLVRGLLAESILLALAGGLFGVAIAAFGVRVIAALDAAEIALLDETRLDPVALGVTALVTMLAAVLFGLVPALHASKGVASGLASSTARSTGDRRRTRLRSVLVAVEIAFAAALLIGAGLLARSFWSLSKVNLGFEPRGVQTLSISLPTIAYADVDRRAAFTDDLLARLRARSDVTHAAVVLGVPLTNFSYYFGILEKDGQRVGADDRTAVELRIVSPEFFATLGIPILRGRVFADSDRRSTTAVAVLNSAAARVLWPDSNAIGHRVLLPTRLWRGGPRAGGEVVGVVGDIHDTGPARRVRPTVYLAQAQFPSDSLTVLVKSSAAPAEIVPWMRAAVGAADPGVPMFRVRTMDEFAARAVAQPRLYLVLLGLFAATAITLAAVGIYGVMAQNVGARTREIGIRVALGATRREVLSMVIGNAGRMAVIGLLTGVGIAVLVRPAIATLLFGVEPIDLPTYAVVAVVTLIVALAAAWLPARRAASINPVVVLKAD
ncbi:MAG TPA: ABC transporter permease [Vicinamibacterales bacterium]|nr:ABC transporter permease [Vicinamibacterales bacterium]